MTNPTDYEADAHDIIEMTDAESWQGDDKIAAYLRARDLIIMAECLYSPSLEERQAIDRVERSIKNGHSMSWECAKTLLEVVRRCTSVPTPESEGSGIVCWHPNICTGKHDERGACIPLSKGEKS